RVAVAPRPPQPTHLVLRQSGGRPLAGRCAGIGRVVALRLQPERPLVVLFKEDEICHVWVGQGRVRKVRQADLVEYEGALPPEEEAIARDILRLHTLPEGAPVAFLQSDPPGVTGHGVLVERCRFGALVQASDGRRMAVGFRRLWPDDHWIN
ncbi:MAG: hypothetical protein RMJ98_17860, partial [Myxococcales bacterium]|nr:hypothetical protein [Myxococcales bacterium]